MNSCSQQVSVPATRVFLTPHPCTAQSRTLPPCLFHQRLLHSDCIECWSLLSRAWEEVYNTLLACPLPCPSIPYFRQKSTVIY